MDVPRYVQIDKHKIAYYRQGSGEPMVLLHGITTYSFIWRNLVPSLSRKYDVIAFDLLGCGGSDQPEETDYSISAQADYIHQALVELGLDRAHMVCHDIGGGIGQIMAVRYPQMVHDLTLINSVAYDMWPVQPISSLRIPLFRQLAMALLDMVFFETLVKLGVYHKGLVTAELMEYFYHPFRTPRGKQAFLQLAKSLDNQNLTLIADELSHLDIPVLIIRGDTDFYLRGEIAKKLHSEIPDSRLEHIATGGHYLQLDEPEKLIKLVLEFCASGEDA